MVSFSPDGQYILWVDQVHRMRLPNRNAESSPVRIVPVTGGDPMLVSDDLLVFLAWWSPNDYALAYLVHDLQDTSASGLYIASAPGEAGQKVLEGMFLPPNGRMSVPVMWATNDVILLSHAPDDGMVAVQLGS
jgi:hypothetical protein